MHIIKSLLALALTSISGTTLANVINLMDYVTPAADIKQVKIKYRAAPKAYPYSVNGKELTHDLTYHITQNSVTYKTYNHAAKLISTQTFTVHGQMITFTGDLGPAIWDPATTSANHQPYNFSYTFPKILRGQYQQDIDNGQGTLTISQQAETSQTSDCIKIAFIHKVDTDAGESYPNSSTSVFCKGRGFLQSDYSTSNVTISQTVTK